jgi:hypothetical protein
VGGGWRVRVGKKNCFKRLLNNTQKKVITQELVGRFFSRCAKISLFSILPIWFGVTPVKSKDIGKYYLPTGSYKFTFVQSNCLHSN